jgi:hypothetical protein
MRDHRAERRAWVLQLIRIAVCSITIDSDSQIPSISG